ncbi:RNA polymerase factor sigma-54 [Pelosinus sp. IPA-1]|uniref:RNA polymerase factor sigma-54 n=1 Tax=Pelosinus sp. IPA-1 TaxID=3029569 RepID=UPI002436295A|nr:RNA polymerase factor sigma-54 [Pelosinus sp. IPA-1]GMB01776.1 RNA polymerase sigma-54 factor [Pelosinus sp. IPA-1]
MIPINLGYGLKLELNQKLMMTPELRQAIAILQLSALELSEMIEQEVLENPVLEIAEKQSDEPEAEMDEPRREKEQLDDYLNWDDYFNQGMDKKSEYMVADEKTTVEKFVNSNVSLHEHLEFQLHLAVRDEATKIVGNYLIGCIDENGYLCGTLSEAASNLGVKEEIVLEVLELIQTFDPLGVGARDLQECLLIQYQQKGIYDHLVADIISNHLPDVAAGRYKAIAEKLACKPQDVQQAVDVIRTLDPKPGRAFGGEQCSYIIADMSVERVNGKYVITVNDTSIPQLTINPYYRRVAMGADSESKKFIEGRLNSAVWLIKSIEQRRRTLYNVMEAIIELQQDFFDKGPKFLRPLVMKKVAEKIEVHESTVSRAIANKYVDTPHGLVSLRSFFSTAVHNSEGGQDVSATKVKQKIKELIVAEDSSDPYSDQTLSEILCQHGMKISRRTVAIYREEQGIASSAKRKRY